jgi:hypothetical protein
MVIDNAMEKGTWFRISMSVEAKVMSITIPLSLTQEG